MAQLIINQMPDLGKEANVCAFGKARNDINTIAEKAGIGTVYVRCEFYKLPLRTTWHVLHIYQRMLRNVEHGTEMIFQYPVSVPKALPLTIKMMHHKGLKVTFLIHDINAFRYQRDTAKEVAILNKADRLIVHTDAMKQLLSQHGVTAPMTVLHLFDYLSQDKVVTGGGIMLRKHEVVFAGFLKKSKFLPELCQHPFDGIQFNLYGEKGDMSFEAFPHIHYKGIFDSNHVGSISGGWGLVWDGDTITSCKGNLGEYLRYNLPHKLSLYIAADIPVVVWDQSAVAEMVKREQLGLVVSDLRQLPEVIHNVSDEQYTTFLTHVQQMGERLRSGAMTLAALRG